MANIMFYYHDKSGEVIARSYKHFFDIGSRFDTKDPVSGLHHFRATTEYKLSSPQDLMFCMNRLTEEYGEITISTYEYR